MDAPRKSLAFARPIIIAAGISVLGVLFAYQVDAKSELHKQLISASLVLLFGACFGGVVKVLLDQVVDEKRRRDDAAQFVTNVLADLKGVYDHVERARLLIPAHQSAKTYGDEMREDVTAGVVQLRNIIRALQSRGAGMPEGLHGKVKPQVDLMEGYLVALTDEFRSKYRALSDMQRYYEKKADALAEAFAKSSADTPQCKLPSFVWAAVEQLPLLTEFMQGGKKYQSKFKEPLDAASRLLREAHAELIGYRQDG